MVFYLKPSNSEEGLDFFVEMDDGSSKEVVKQSLRAML